MARHRSFTWTMTGATLGCSVGICCLMGFLGIGMAQAQTFSGATPAGDLVGPAPVGQALRGHVPCAVREMKLQPTGRLPGAQILNLAIGLKLRNIDALERLLRELDDPSSPNYRHYLTPEQFAEQFGPSEQDYQAVIAFAEANGLNVTARHRSRVVLSVNGRATDIEKTFHIALRTYRHPTEAREFHAPDAEPALDLAVAVLNVEGLDNYALPRPMSRVRKLPSITSNSGSGPGGTYRGGDFRAAYVPGTTLNGTGQNVGLLQFDGYYSNDIASYVSQAGISTSVILTNIPIDGGVGTPGSGNGEVCLDIEMAIAMAPGLSTIFVYEAPNPSPWVDLLSRMADDNSARQLSCSWNGGSPNATAEQIFKQMAAQGQSFFNATGDSNAFTDAISFPCDSTNITQVGGTTLTTGAGAAYVSETVWNWGGGTGSGGGISTYYPIPAYQQGINMAASQGSTTMRNVPDVALTADNIWVTSDNGGTGTFGGTSCAAPLWAGFTALVNQQAAANGWMPVGFLNPILYSIGKSAAYASDFHDITTGDNTWSSSPSMFYAVTGYDLCTGWGSPRGTNLINELAPNGPNLVLTGATLLAEGCSPTNGVIDPDETVVVAFTLKNIGSTATSNLVATLLATNGVTLPGDPQTYGVIAGGGGTATQPFAFTAAGECGGALTATLRLQDGVKNVGALLHTFTLGQLVAAMPLAQSFDAVTAPTLPSEWTSSASGAQALWVTSTGATDTSPNAAFTAGTNAAGVNELVSPAFDVCATSAQLRFRHNYNLQTGPTSGRDGGVLEIQIGTNAFADILTAGGSFISNGYVRAISSNRGNPLGGRQAWTGNSGGFRTTIVALPASAAGHIVRLKWRCGTDNSTSSTGWYIDTLAVTDSSYVCCGTSSPADVALAAAAAPNPVIAGSNLTFTLTVSNLGPATATDVTITNPLPAGAALVSATPSQGSATNMAGTVVAALGALANNTAATLEVVVTPAGAGTLTNTATVAVDGFDPVLANNTATAVVTVLSRPQLDVNPASHDFGAVATGTTAQTAFLVTNLGAATLTGTAAALGGPFTVVSGSTYVVDGFAATDVVVRFSPSSADSFSNSVIFTSNGGTLTNVVQGAGAVVPMASFSGSPTYGPVPLGVTFTDTSAGTIPPTSHSRSRTTPSSPGSG